MSMTVDAGQRVKAFIETEILLEGGEAVTPETPLLDGVIDSLALMQLVAFLEEEFDIEVDDADITKDNFATVAHIQRLVEEKAESA